MELKEFLDMIRAYRRRLNLAEFLKKLLFSLRVGAAAGIVFQAAAFLVPLYYANVYTALALFAAVAAALAATLLRSVTMEHTALVMDGFGFQERIITAYENRGEEGVLFALQRKDAMEQLRLYRDRIRVPLWPGRRRTALTAVLLILMTVLAFTPSPMKDQAGVLHKVSREAREKEEELKEIVEELEELAQLEQETLTPEQLAALQEMIESLRASMEEYSQVSTEEALQAAGEKLSYKYEDLGSRMTGLAQSLQSGAAISPMTAESMQAMADKLQQMSGKPAQGGDSLASNQGQNGESQDGQGGSNQNGQNGQGNGSGSGEDGQGDGQAGQGDGQNGQGAGQGGGQSGQGDGQGSQGGGQSGQGDDPGAGRGTGSVNREHDYVSIPNAVADAGNLTGNAEGHDGSDFFRAQNGLSWEGTHVPYEAVIGSYERNAYEGIAAGRYPSGMEDVIKEYFSSFNDSRGQNAAGD